jgi:hypothetical protein
MTSRDVTGRFLPAQVSSSSLASASDGGADQPQEPVGPPGEGGAGRTLAGLVGLAFGVILLVVAWQLVTDDPTAEAANSGAPIAVSSDSVAPSTSIDPAAPSSATTPVQTVDVDVTGPDADDTADGDPADGDTADGATADGDPADGDTADGDTTDGDSADADATDGDPADSGTDGDPGQAVPGPTSCRVEPESIINPNPGVRVTEDSGDYAASYTFIDDAGNELVRTIELGSPTSGGFRYLEWNDGFDAEAVVAVSAEREAGLSDPVPCERP